MLGNQLAVCKEVVCSSSCVIWILVVECFGLFVSNSPSPAFFYSRHVQNVSDIESLVIVSEESIAKGIRRIVALTGSEADRVSSRWFFVTLPLIISCIYPWNVMLVFDSETIELLLTFPIRDWCEYREWSYRIASSMESRFWSSIEPYTIWVNLAY